MAEPAERATHPLLASRVERMQSSLFGEILDWMLVPLLLLWPISIGVTYFVAKSIANQPFDRGLEDRITVLAQQMQATHGLLPTRLGPASQELLLADGTDRLLYQVLGPHGQLLDGEASLPPFHEEQHRAWHVSLRDELWRGSAIRVATLWLPVDARQEEQGWIQVQLAETLEKRAQLASQIVKGVILPEFIILPVALVLVWFALTRGLAPLTDLQRRIRHRKSGDLSPIESGNVPEEISPLVASLNDLLGRVSESIAMQKRFVADAAHQMKTPLAGMRTQSELALRQDDAHEVRHSLEQLAKSSEAATRLVNQLLTLARAEDSGHILSPRTPLDLTELAREATQEWFSKAHQRAIDLGLEQPGRPVMVRGNAVMLREMLNNLIDNALRYSPDAAHVTIRVGTDREHRWAHLEVEDNGPGIPPQERQQVFQRFYRILGSRTE